MSDANDQTVVRNQALLVRACKLAGIPMFFATLEIFLPNAGPYHVQDGLDGSGIIKDVLAEARGSRCYSVTQKAGNVFADTNLEEKIKSFGRWQIILAGAMANACVKGTAIGAAGDNQEVARGAVQRGFTVHTTPDIILGELEQWPDAVQGVRCYTRY